MVNRVRARAADVELAGQAGGGIAILDAELAPRAVAIGVDRGLRHAEFAGDLFGAEMLVDQPQAITLTRCQHVDSVRDISQRPLQSVRHSKRRLSRHVYLDPRIRATRVVL
jgi:hypothetical protein